MSQFACLAKEFNKLEYKNLDSFIKVYKKGSSKISFFYLRKNSNILLSLKVSDQIVPIDKNQEESNKIIDKRKVYNFEWFGSIEEWEKICRRYEV